MATQTDNSYLEEKVQLRLDTVNMIDKDVISVLECYAGDGYIWSEVRLHTKKEIKVLLFFRYSEIDIVFLLKSANRNAGVDSEERLILPEVYFSPKFK